MVSRKNSPWKGTSCCAYCYGTVLEPGISSAKQRTHHHLQRLAEYISKKIQNTFFLAVIFCLNRAVKNIRIKKGQLRHCNQRTKKQCNQLLTQVEIQRTMNYRYDRSSLVKVAFSLSQTSQQTICRIFLSICFSVGYGTRQNTNR